MYKNRYALLTVDTEALPHRASENHVQRLMWGRHDNGTAGIMEMCAIGDSFGARHVFFVDMCACLNYFKEVVEVVQWLDANGQDVQLHAHPEYLPLEFLQRHGFPLIRRKMMRMDRCNLRRSIFVLRHFSERMSKILQRPVRAFRAGSFRWNRGTLLALERCNIPLSFNNSMQAFARGRNLYSIPQSSSYRWSNGIYEISVTEQERFLKSGHWDRLQYPQSTFLNVTPPWLSCLPYTLKRTHDFLVVLLHSWSFLYMDKNGFFTYKDERRLELYHTYLKRLTKDYDVITTAELLDLLESGKITPTHTEDIDKVVDTRKPRKRPAKMRQRKKIIG